MEAEVVASSGLLDYVEVVGKLETEGKRGNNGSYSFWKSSFAPSRKESPVIVIEIGLHAGETTSMPNAISSDEFEIMIKLVSGKADINT